MEDEDYTSDTGDMEINDPNRQKDKKRSNPDTSTDSSPIVQTDKKKMRKNPDEPNLTIYIKGKTTKLPILAKKKPMALKKDIISQIGHNDTTKITGESIRITCRDAAQLAKAKCIKSLLDNDVIVTEPFVLAKSKDRNETLNKRLLKGIIFGIPEDISEDELTEELNVEWTRRLYKFEADEKHPTTTVVFATSDQTLPEYVNIGFVRKRVKTYIPRPFRCYGCQKFGHQISNCSSKLRCPRCGEQHEYNKCTKTDNPKCANCGGAHSAGYKECPTYLTVQKTLHVSATEHISYADAAKKLTKPSQQIVISEESFPSLGTSVVVIDTRNREQNNSSTAILPQCSQTSNAHNANTERKQLNVTDSLTGSVINISNENEDNTEFDGQNEL